VKGNDASNEETPKLVAFQHGDPFGKKLGPIRLDMEGWTFRKLLIISV